MKKTRKSARGPAAAVHRAARLDPTRTEEAPDLNRSAVAATVGRIPQQARSRERYTSILDVCRELIAEQGATGLRMSEIARRAGVPIASVYQYFPTKTVIIAQLFAREQERFRELVGRRLGKATDAGKCAQALRSALREIYELNRTQLFMREIWHSALADRAIHEMYLTSIGEYAQLWFHTARQAGSPIPDKLLQLRAQIVNEMWYGTIALATRLEKALGARLMEESIGIGLRELGMSGAV